jgi:hypothetical protein
MDPCIGVVSLLIGVVSLLTARKILYKLMLFPNNFDFSIGNFV